LATTWNKPVSRELTLKTPGGGEVSVVVTLDADGVSLRKSGHRKSSFVGYAELFAELPK